MQQFLKSVNDNTNNSNTNKCLQRGREEADARFVQKIRSEGKTNKSLFSQDCRVFF